MALAILSVVVTPINEVGKFLFGTLKRQIDYLTNYDTNIQNLKSRARQLKLKRADVQTSVEEARMRLDVPYEEVVEWLKSTQEIEEGMAIFEDKEVNANKKCFGGLCPDLGSRLKLSKQAVRKVEFVSSLQAQANFSAIAHPQSLPTVEYVRTGSIVSDIPSRDSVMEVVMGALRDERIRSIGVHGMGGIGKTTLMIRINNELQGSQLFNKVILVTVRRNPDLNTIQDDIADSLRLDLKKVNSSNRRANLLWERLQGEKTVLIILDNVWTKIKLTEIGLPSASEHIGCKIILTTRDREICSQMGIQKIIKMDFLSHDESWTLFKAKAGGVVELPNLQLKAHEIVIRCKGSPLAIVTLGSALKEVDDESEWINALRVLNDPDPSGLVDIMPEVIESLRFSYDSLRIPEIKLCFLFCCLFPADYNIKISDLRNYGIGDGFLKSTRTLDDALNELHSHVKKLKNCCLLLDGDEEMSVKMHEVVRDVATLIASEAENGFLINVGGELRNLQGTEKWTGSKRISLMNNSDTKNVGAFKLESSQLRSLLIRGNRVPTRTDIGQDCYFEGVKELAVLDLWSIYNWNSSVLSTTQSLSYLTNLRTLYLIACDVSGKVSLLGGMKKLEILIMRDSNIDRLEKEIGNLANLKCLDLTGAEIEFIAPNVILRLSKLEELYMWNNYDGWDTKGRGGEHNARFSEVASLDRLSILEIRVKNVVSHNLYSADNLKQFRVAMNEKPGKLERYMNSNDLCIKNVNLARHWINKLMSNSNRNLVLSLESCCGFKNVADLDTKRLEYLDVSRCNEIMYLIRTEQSKTVRDEPLLGQLRVIRAFECVKLKSILSLNLLLPVQSLENLEEVMVGNCAALQEVFNTEGELGLLEAEIEGIGTTPTTAMFPKLQRIELWGLSKLTSIWKGVVPFGSLGNLTELRVRNCDGLKFLLPEGLQSLEILEIFNCSGMENLTLSKTQEEMTSSSTTQKLIPNLRHLKIFDCPRLKKLFSFGVARDLQQLNSLCIKDCHNLKEIIGNEEDRDGEVEAVEHQGLLPQLQCLEIENLGSVTSFYQGNLPISCPLEEIEVRRCPNLEGLPLDPHSLYHLQKIQGDFRWFQALELEDESQECTTISDKKFQGRGGEEYDYRGKKIEEAENFVELMDKNKRSMDPSRDYLDKGKDKHPIVRSQSLLGFQKRQMEPGESSHNHPSILPHSRDTELQRGVQEGEEVEAVEELERGVQGEKKDAVGEEKLALLQIGEDWYYAHSKDGILTGFGPNLRDLHISLIALILSVLLGIGVVAKFISPMVIAGRGLELLSATSGFSTSTGSKKSPLPTFDLAKEIQADWKSEQESFLINLMMETVIARGDARVEGIFSMDEYLEMRMKYYMRWGLKYSSKAFKDMFTTLKQRLTEFKELVENSRGLGWDSWLNTVDAPDSWWENYVKLHPNAKRFRTQGFPEQKNLEVIFGVVIGTGHLQAKENQDFNSPDENDQSKKGTQPRNWETNESIRPKLSEAVFIQAEASHTRQEWRDKFSVTECMEILDAMDINIVRRTYVRALKLLQKKDWREAFLYMSDARRKDLLLSIEDGVI